MLLDEPFSALDTGLRASTRKAVAAIAHRRRGDDAAGDARPGGGAVDRRPDRGHARRALHPGRRAAETSTGSPTTASPPSSSATASRCPCTVASGIAECALGRVPVQTAVGDGPATLALRPEQLVATVVSDSASGRDGVGTVIATEFLGHDVLLTIDPPATSRRSSCASTASTRPPIDAKVRIEVIGSGVALTVSRLVDHLRRHGDRRGGNDRNRVADLPRTRRPGGRRPPPNSAKPAGSLVLLETRNDLSTLVHYLGALAGDHVVLPVSAGRDHSACCAPMTPTSSSTRDRYPRRADRKRPPAASRPRAAAVDVGQHRIAEAGPAVPAQSGRERDGDRRLSRYSRKPTGPQRLCRCRTATACR